MQAFLSEEPNTNAQMILKSKTHFWDKKNKSFIHHLSELSILFVCHSNMTIY